MPHPGLFIALSLLGAGVAPEVHTAGIPIIWGSDEVVANMGELSPEDAKKLPKEIGTQATVTFRFERLHVYYLDLWTWNGQHLLHCGDKYWTLDANEWQGLIGADPSQKYGKPLRYHIPVLPALIAVVAVGYGVRKRFFKTEQEKLAALMNDKRYERAVETIFGKDDGGESGVVIPIFDESKFEHAKRQLIAEDVAADTAEANLRKIVAAVVVNVDSQIDACLEYAAQLDQAGEWDKSAEVYAKVILALPDADPRKAKARNLLTSMIEKRNASAAENAQQGSSAE